MDRQEKLADENRHSNRWAQAQQMSSPPNYQPMMMGGTVHSRSTLRPGKPREVNTEAEEEVADFS